MSNPLGSADFFALEAGECLDRLEQLLGRPDGPPPDELLRYARALRGSALMANQPAIARAAAGVEALARALRAGTRTWDPALREQLGQAIDEFRQLVRRAREWSSADAARAARLTSALETLTGGAPPAPDRAASPGSAVPIELNTGVRAFVARESALIASALDRAAQALVDTPDAREPLYAVLRRMQSLRGLAEIAELTPLPEILDGIELAVGDLTRLFAPPAGVDDLLRAAAQSLTRIACDVASVGKPAPDPDEARLFTERLLRAFAVERDVVAIELLYIDGDPAPMERPTTQPHFSVRAPLGPVELVSYGEHLVQAADRIEDAESATIRDLRLYALVATLRSLAIGGEDAVPAALAVFGRSAREAIGSGAAAAAPDGFAAALRDIGGLVRGLAQSADQHVTARRLLDVAYRIDQLDAPAEPDVVSIESLANDGESDVVPVGSLAYTESPDEATDAEPVIAIGELAPDGPVPEPDGPTALETSYVTYTRLIREHGLGPASIEALVAGSRSAAGTVPATDDAAVDIRSLCYRGRAALERAAEVRDALARRLGAGLVQGESEPLLHELLDLVPLALERAD